MLRDLQQLSIFTLQNLLMLFSCPFPQNPFLKSVLEEYRECTEEELNLHGYKYGTFMTTLLTECRYFLPYLTRRSVLG